VRVKYSADGGGTPYDISGWIVGFHYWKPKGSFTGGAGIHQAERFEQQAEYFKLTPEYVGGLVIDGNGYLWRSPHR